jgi:hypothetical protein
MMENKLKIILNDVTDQVLGLFSRGQFESYKF